MMNEMDNNAKPVGGLTRNQRKALKKMKDREAKSAAGGVEVSNGAWVYNYKFICFVYGVYLV